MTRARLVLATGVAGVLSGLLVAVVVILVVRQAWASGVESAGGNVPAAVTAGAVLLVVAGVATTVRRIRFDVGPAVPWIAGGVSLLLSLVPLALLSWGSSSSATLMYRGLRVPQGIERFWDLALVLRSVDCARWGFDVYAEHNGCLQDPSIYGPGSLWLMHIPGMSFSNALGLGTLAIVMSSLMLVWLGRQAEGVGRVALLCCAAGAPWLLLLERGNFDAFVLWSAVFLVFVVRRFPGRLWPWLVGGAGIWLMGTFKFYPFVLLLMLIPVLRLRRGWIVLGLWFFLAAAFVAVTWENLRFSTASNSAMVDLGDYVVLGRLPVIARIALPVWGDVLLMLLAGMCFLAGVTWALARPGLSTSRGMLAVGGSGPFLAAVLLAGFGWAYKASFLLLCVPLLSAVPKSGRGPLTAWPLVSLVCVVISGVVVWNTTLATLAGIVAASFAAGAGGVVMIRSIRSSAAEHVQSDCSRV